MSLAEKISRFLKAHIKVPEEVYKIISQPKTFTKFRQLPDEIRRAIWKASLPAPRVFEPKVYDNELDNYEEGKPTRFIREWKTPPRMKGACRETYAVCMSLGRFTFGRFKNSSIRGFWFNDEHDAVYFSRYGQWDGNRVRGIQTVYVSTDIALTELIGKGFENDNLTACRHLIVTLS
ncbi:hypothetical protein LZ32DRAFT_652468 [Colletotrichum eremochloae]|nr:hypothetical protein LZ32DRAFT_652468 [Colletotrichum eremochloae]